VLGTVGAVALAMVPDWDMRILFISHRGPTHTVWFALAVGSLIGARTGLLAALGPGPFAFVVGTVTIGSHILADALTPMGVRPLVPYREARYTVEITRASNPAANYVLFLLGAGAFVVALVGGVSIGNAV